MIQDHLDFQLILTIHPGGRFGFVFFLPLFLKSNNKGFFYLQFLWKQGYFIFGEQATQTISADEHCLTLEAWWRNTSYVSNYEGSEFMLSVSTHSLLLSCTYQCYSTAKYFLQLDKPTLRPQLQKNNSCAILGGPAYISIFFSEIKNLKAFFFFFFFGYFHNFCLNF